MERVAQRCIDPHDVGRLTLTRQQPDTAAIVRIPAEGEPAGEGEIEVDGDREVVDDGVPLGERHVVHHRHAGQRDVDGAADLALGANHDVLHVVHPLAPRIHDRMHLTGVGVDLRVGGEGTGQGAEEVVSAHGVEFVGELDRTTTCFHHRPRGAGEPADVGVGRDRVVVPVATRDVGHTALSAERGRTDVPVAVPLGSALADANPMHHAGTHEPVVGGGLDCAERVRAVAEVAPLELGGELTDHREIELGHLVGDWRVVPAEVRGRGHDGAPLNGNNVVTDHRTSIGGCQRSGSWKPIVEPPTNFFLKLIVVFRG